MNIRHARPDDLGKILEIYQYARTVMAQSGNPGQWVNGYPSLELLESDLAKNPYIAYNCIRLAGKIAVATNGSHTDPIIEKIKAGMNLRDAFALSLLAMDYEKDSLDTPRIAVGVDAETKQGVVAIVRKDALLVNLYDLVPGKLYYVSTYGKNAPSLDNVDNGFDAACADCACNYVISQGVFADFENPVTSAAAVWTGSGYHLSVKDA